MTCSACKIWFNHNHNKNAFGIPEFTLSNHGVVVALFCRVSISSMCAALVENLFLTTSNVIQSNHHWVVVVVIYLESRWCNSKARKEKKKRPCRKNRRLLVILAVMEAAAAAAAAALVQQITTREEFQWYCWWNSCFCFALPCHHENKQQQQQDRQSMFVLHAQLSLLFLSFAGISYYGYLSYYILYNNNFGKLIFSIDSKLLAYQSPYRLLRSFSL